MLIDILAGLVVVYSAWSGSQHGAIAALYRAGFTGLALVFAKLLCGPTARYIIKGIEWSAPYAYGLCFLVYFLIIAVALGFATASLLRNAEGQGDGGTLDRGVGFLLGAGRGGIVGYGLLAATILITHRVGAHRPMFAFAYDKSYAGRIVLTRNIADPEPFPNAYFLQVLVGAKENQGFNPEAIGLAKQLDSGTFIDADVALNDALKAGDWKAIRKHPALLAWMCSHEFLRLADDFITPRHKVEAEDPNQRFKELRAK